MTVGYSVLGKGDPRSPTVSVFPAKFKVSYQDYYFFLGVRWGYPRVVSGWVGSDSLVSLGVPPSLSSSSDLLSSLVDTLFPFLFRSTLRSPSELLRSLSHTYRLRVFMCFFSPSTDPSFRLRPSATRSIRYDSTNFKLRFRWPLGNSFQFLRSPC